MRGINRIYSTTADNWTASIPTSTASFFKLFISFLQISYLTNRCPTSLRDQANFPRRKTQSYKSIFTGNQLNTCTSRTSKLSTYARIQFNIMHCYSKWNIPQRYYVSNINWNTKTDDNHLPNLKIFWRKDI